MNQWAIIIIGIILFALATMLLYFIGLKRKMGEQRRLEEMLLNNGARKVIGYLKSHEKATADEIGSIIEDIRAREFHSSKAAVISDGDLFKHRLIDYMLEKEYICSEKENGGTFYVLPERNRNLNG